MQTILFLTREIAIQLLTGTAVTRQETKAIEIMDKLVYV